MRYGGTDCKLGPYIDKERILSIIYASIHLACLIPPLLNYITNQNFSILNICLSLLVFLSHLCNLIFAIIGMCVAFSDVEYPEEAEKLIGTVRFFIILRLVFYGSVLLLVIGQLTKCVIS